MGTGRSDEAKQALKKAQKQSLRGACEGSENRGLALMGEASESVRGLTRIPYP